jgi:uncharacterized protein (TIGR00106 family)
MPREAALPPPAPLLVPRELAVLAQADLEEPEEDRTAETCGDEAGGEDPAGQPIDQNGADHAGQDEHGGRPEREDPRARGHQPTVPPRARRVATPPRGTRWLTCAVATADLTVIALGRPDASASAYIAEIQRRLATQDRVRFRMHAMGTSLEGTTADILALVGDLHAIPFESGVPRVYTVLKLDERRDRPDQTLEDKVRSVEERLAGAEGSPG